MGFTDSVPQLNSAPRPVPYSDSAHEDDCEADPVRVFRGLMLAVALCAPVWAAILWLLL